VNRPVLITGAAGFAGGHLLQLLSGASDLVAWARSTPKPGFATLARWQQVDLLDRERVRSLIADLRPAAVYHLAGFSQVAESFADTAKPLATNVLATHYLFDALRRTGASSRVLVTGSASVYAASASPLTEHSPVAPQSPYATSKLAQEQLGERALIEDGLELILTRPFNHTGPRQTPSFMAPSVARQVAMIERGQMEPVLRVGNTSAIRDLSDVRDVVRAYQALMRDGVPGTIYNVASGVGRSVRQIIDALTARATTSVRIEVDPSKLRPVDLPVLVGDASRLARATGWTPLIPFEQMIDDLLDYWRHRESRVEQV
jgi:GDP-4-dehydro-6-deoxy-D-mannose reductase